MAAAVALEPEHLSLYGLTIDEGTAFKKRVEKGLLPEPDEDLAADMYELAETMLAEAGFRQYEISNWARLQKECHFVGGEDLSHQMLLPSRHNLTYWLNEPYLGFGPGAHSWFGGRRFWNINAPQTYIEQLGRGESVEGGAESISTALERAETVILALRLNEGISRARFTQRFDASLDALYGPVWKQSAAWGLLEDDGERLRLTPRGRLLSNEVFQRLLPDSVSPGDQHAYTTNRGSRDHISNRGSRVRRIRSHDQVLQPVTLRVAPALELVMHQPARARQLRGCLAARVSG